MSRRTEERKTGVGRRGSRAARVPAADKETSPTRLFALVSRESTIGVKL